MNSDRPAFIFLIFFANGAETNGRAQVDTVAGWCALHGMGRQDSGWPTELAAGPQIGEKQNDKTKRHWCTAKPLNGAELSLGGMVGQTILNLPMTCSGMGCQKKCKKKT